MASLVKLTIYCLACDDIYDVRVDDRDAALGNLACPMCYGAAELYERDNSAREEGCAYERAFGDGNDVGG